MLVSQSRKAGLRQSFWIKAVFFIGLLLFCGGLFAVTFLGARESLLHRVQVETDLRVPLDVVWQRLTDFRSYPQWRPEISLVQVMSEDSSGTIYREFLDDHEGMRFRVEEQQVGKLLVVHNISDNFPLNVIWTWELCGDEQNCHLRLTEEGQVNSSSFRFYLRYVVGYDSQIKHRLKQLENSFGTGAPAPVSRR